MAANDPSTGPGSHAGASGGGAPWYAAPERGYQPDEQAFIANKGWGSERDLFTSYRELEKMRGVPKERLLVRPEREDDAEGWSAFYGQLGRPEKADGYELPEIQLGEGQADIREAFRAQAHAVGLNKSQARKLADWFVSQGGQLQEASQRDRATRQELEDRELRTEWGQEYEPNIGKAREVYKRVAQAAGWESPEEMQQDFSAIEEKIGTKRLLKMMAFLGRGTGEASFVEGSGAGGGSPAAPFGVTPAVAQGQFQALSRNPEFMAKVMAGDPAAQRQFSAAAEAAASAGMRGSGPPR